MKNNLIIKYGVVALLLSGWISCGQNPPYPLEEPEDGIKIENLQTRLRIVESLFAEDIVPLQELWYANPKGIIMNYLPEQYHEGGAYFGYEDVDGKTVLCEVINFSEYAKQWKGEFVHTMVFVTVTEINVQMNGTVRLYTGDNGEKYGTLELTSLEPTGPESDKPALRPGVYVETYPYPGNTRIDFIDGEKVNITQNCNFSPELYKYKYEIREHTVKFTEIDGTRGHEKFFRVVNNSQIEIEYSYIVTAERVGWQILTLEREK
jgi:hypothetical protein